MSGGGDKNGEHLSRIVVEDLIGEARHHANMMQEQVVAAPVRYLLKDATRLLLSLAHALEHERDADGVPFRDKWAGGAQRSHVVTLAKCECPQEGICLGMVSQGQRCAVSSTVPIRACLQWCVDHDGECLGDHQSILASCIEALKNAPSLQEQADDELRMRLDASCPICGHDQPHSHHWPWALSARATTGGVGLSVHEASVIAAAVQLAPLLEAGWDDQDTPEDQNEGSKACDALVAAVNAMVAADGTAKA